MEERLTRIENKIDLLIELIKPVNEHAPFVDDLKHACQSSRLLRSFIPIRPPASPPLAIHDEAVVPLSPKSDNSSNIND